jgi:DNA-binding CsgD family transcriptional regulator
LTVASPYSERVPVTQDLAHRIERLCRDTLNGKMLRERVLAELRRAMPFDGHVFMLTDPVTRIATSPLADVPALPWSRLPELIRWRYLTTVNRWSDLLDAGIRATSLLRATEGDPSRSLMWLHVQRELGVIDTLAAPLGDRYGCWGALDLWRTSGAPFSDAELSFVDSINASLAEGLRNAVARTFADETEQLQPVGPAVVMLGPDLQVRIQTEGAATTLLQLLPPDEPITPIPAAAYNIGGALIAGENGVPVGLPWARVRLGGSRWVTVKASRIGDGDIAVSIEPSTPSERMDLYARAHGLSIRESEVLSLLGTGLDSRAIADRLFLSDHTVNDHVKSILAKTGTRTRQLLISRALGA